MTFSAIHRCNPIGSARCHSLGAAPAWPRHKKAAATPAAAPRASRHPLPHTIEQFGSSNQPPRRLLCRPCTSTALCAVATPFASARTRWWRRVGEREPLVPLAGVPCYPNTQAAMVGLPAVGNARRLTGSSEKNSGVHCMCLWSCHTRHAQPMGQITGWLLASRTADCRASFSTPC